MQPKTNKNPNPQGAGDFSKNSTQVRTLREKEPPKTLRCELYDGWWLHPDLYTKVINCYDDETGVDVDIRVSDLINVKNIDELEEMIKNDPGHLTIYAPREIQRALYEKLGAKYKVVDPSLHIWKKVDTEGADFTPDY